MKKFSILLVFLVFITACSKRSKIKTVGKNVQNIDNVTSEISDLLSNSIDNSIFKTYTITMSLENSIDSLCKSELKFWMLNGNNINQNEKKLLQKLIRIASNDELGTQKGTTSQILSNSNHESDELYIQNLSKIVFNSNLSVAVLNLETYFKKKQSERITGWEEIVFLKKQDGIWAEYKRIMYMEY